VSPFDDKVILDASKKEFARKGQIFFIHNRVETIEAMRNHLEELLP
jgi:transcription-repair coupling factor (superfamily II helicase)